MPRLVDLPLELLDLVLSWLRERDIRNVLLTCTALYLPSQRLLLGHLRLSSRSLDAFVSASPRMQALARANVSRLHVHFPIYTKEDFGSLHLAVSERASIVWLTRLAQRLDSVASFIASTAHLRSFGLHCGLAIDPEHPLLTCQEYLHMSSVLNLLQSLPAPSLTSLSLEFHGTSLVGSPTHLCSELSRLELPHLRKLYYRARTVCSTLLDGASGANRPCLEKCRINLSLADTHHALSSMSSAVACPCTDSCPHLDLVTRLRIAGAQAADRLPRLRSFQISRFEFLEQRVRTFEYLSHVCKEVRDAPD